MKRLNMSHLSALARSEHFIRAAISRITSDSHRHSIERDLMRIAEVKKFILFHIQNPGLPIITDPDPNVGPCETVKLLESSSDGNSSS